MTKLSKFFHFFLFKVLYVFVINGTTILFSKHGLKDGNVQADTGVNTYVTKRRFLLVLNLTKYTIKESKEIQVKKNIKKISS